MGPMAPIDYSGAFSGANAYDSVMGGMKDGIALQQLQAERAQKQAALAQQKQMQTDMAALSQNPTVAGVNALMVKYPALAEPYEKVAKSLAPEEARVRVEAAMPVFQALRKQQPEVAAKVLREQATAYRNAGKEQEAAAAEATAKQVEDNPQAAQFSLTGVLSSVIGADKLAKMVADWDGNERSAELQPGLVRKGAAEADKAGSEATTAGVTAKHAEANALADLEAKGWKLKEIQADIEFKRNQTQIGYLNAKIARENNAIQKQKLQLELDKAVSERDDKVRDKVAKVEGAVTSMDNMLNTVERLLANDELNDVLGSVEGRMPGISDGESDAVSLIEQLGSQAFLSQVPNIQGMGALSNAEGAKLEAAFQNFGRKQSEKQFRANLDEVKRLVGKARDTVSKRYGVPIGSPDIPAAKQPQSPAIPDGWSVQER